MAFKHDVAIIGGLGHVGLPLGIIFADKGLDTVLVDIDQKKADKVRIGEMPFIEYGAEPLLKRALENKKLHISTLLSDIQGAEFVIITIGTPVDEYHNPRIKPFLDLILAIKPLITPEQTLIIRSTIYPRTCEQARALLGPGAWKIAYCPERIVEGYAIKELVEIPQIIAGLTDEAYAAADRLFKHISPKIIRVSIGEAELIKLYSNAWRYIQFAVANNFYMIADSFGVDYESVRRAMRDSYSRATIPSAGFAAGPCLFKDTMQLSVFNNNQFQLGYAAMLVNEGLPNFLVEKLRTRHDLSKKTVGILGMAFKADIDDTRESLSFKLAKILRFYGANVLCSDEFAKSESFVSKEQVIEKSDIIIIGVPHSAYKYLWIPEEKELVDMWGITH